MRRTGFLAVICAVVVLAIPASAAGAGQPGVTITPALENITLAAGQNSATFAITVANNTPSQLTVTVATDDFTALNDNGVPQFLGNTSKQAAPHGLAHWMTVTDPEFILAPKASRSVAVAIGDASTMGPGGHYGAVIFHIVTPPTGAGVNIVGANAELSSLVFVTTSDAGMQSIKLLKPMLGFASIQLPDSVNLVFQNTGDVQVAPRGYVTITDTAGKEVARGIINAGSGLILPGTSRLYQVALSSRGRFLWPGYYRLSVAYRYDGQTAYANYDAQFWYIPGQFLAGLGVIALVVFVYIVRRLQPARLYRAKR